MNALTSTAWCFQRLTVIVFLKYLRELRDYGSALPVFYIEATPAALMLCRLCVGGCSFQQLDFKLFDLRDNNGDLLRLRIGYEDLNNLQQRIFARDDVKAFYAVNTVPAPLDMFLKKQSVSFVHQDTNIFRLLIMVYAFRQQLQQAGGDRQLKFIALSCGWDESVRSFMFAKGVHLECVTGVEWSFRKIIKNMLGPMRYRSIYYALLLIKKNFVNLSGKLLTRGGQWLAQLPQPEPVKIITDYYGQSNFDDANRYSDLFFLSSGDIPPKQAALVLNFPNDPLDQQRFDYLNSKGVAVYVLHPQSSLIRQVPYFFSWPDTRGPALIRTQECSRIYGWFKEHVDLFTVEKNYWKDIFLSTGSKIYVNWFKYDTSHCYRVQAMKEAGGVSVYFQRSFEPLPSIETALTTDVLFVYSKLSLDIEQASGSHVDYGVIVGYPGIYQSASLDQEAQGIRQRLLANGARKIVAFFDENSGDDSRWHTGHEPMRANYEFLLTRLLENPNLGLVLKPKVPKTLPRRLGLITPLLEQALQTGRCHMIESEGLYNTLTPALAAKASDLAIHGHFCASTAGIESALTGTPTILLDKEGFSFCSLKERWGHDIVFNDWPTLWRALDEHLNSRYNPRLGNWQHLLDELDPYRDNKARERMTFYLHQLLKGFNNKLDRETVLKLAAEAFSKKWGKDKIFPIGA